MRTFISIELGEARKQLVKIQKMLPEFEGKMTEMENLHLTLKFLGEVTEKEAEEVKKRLGKIDFGKFKIIIDKLGVFSESFIRIMWVGINEKCRELWELQKKIDDALKDLFEKEKRFMGHITIARVKNIKDKKKFIEKLRGIKFDNIEFEADSFKMIKSTLTPKGPVYEEVFNIPLR